MEELKGVQVEIDRVFEPKSNQHQIQQEDLEVTQNENQKLWDEIDGHLKKLENEKSVISPPTIGDEELLQSSQEKMEENLIFPNGIQLLEQSTDSLKFQISAESFDEEFLGMLFCDFIGRKDCKTLLEKKENESTFILNVKCSEFLNSSLENVESSLWHYLQDSVFRYQEGKDYFSSLHRIPTLEQLFYFFKLTTIEDGYIKMGIKNDGERFSIAVHSNQENLLTSFSENGVLMEADGNYSKAILAEKEKDHFLFTFISINNRIRSLQEESISKEAWEKKKNDDQLGNVTPFTLILVTLMELLAVGISFYFMYH